MPRQFARKHPAMAPTLSEEQNTPSQLEQLTADMGLAVLTPAPVQDVVFTIPPHLEKALANSSLYLWAICDANEPEVLFANEKAPCALNTERERVCHTNLTGGRNACGAGELWFEDANTIYLNGRSGRYRLQGKEAMDDVAQVFVRYGYKAGHMGVSRGTGRPRRSARPRDISWFEPDTQ